MENAILTFYYFYYFKAYLNYWSESSFHEKVNSSDNSNWYYYLLM